jgi:hypothetical protein
MIRIVLAVVVSAIVAELNVSGAQAQSFGNAPWCAVLQLGAGEVQWDCNYFSAEECAPTVVAGNRGFCNLNPRFAGRYPDGPPPAWRHPRHRRHHHPRYE